ncbi:carbohydrate ABC transporter permease [Microbacterium atlanticum]|uniref:carbohydrate ABC transporter permease n=1 Tax=Microbacterium atlanticum TaxID=2782168 RepID=UPI0018894DFA|nr:sugar ABC transporter permease [Microbacterium atlanticum]
MISTESVKTGSVALPGERQHSQRRVRRRRRIGLVLALLAPAVALYALFVFAPLAQAAFYSVFKWNGIEPLTDFVGLANYLRAWTDSAFHRALFNNISVIGVSLLVQLPLALWIATLLTGRFRGRAIFRVAFFLPYIISEVIAAVLWDFVLAPTGLVNELLRTIGLDAVAHAWLGDPATVMYAILWVVTWKFFGFYTILFLTALQGVPQEHLEAARIDGANRAQVFRYVTFPAIGPTVRICIFLAIIGSLQLFDLVWVMTQGGPVGASSTMVTYMVRSGLQSYEFGYASAIAVIVAVISFLFAIAYQRWVLSRDNPIDTTARGR